MKSLFSIIILSAFLTQTLSKFVIIVHFEFNREFIAKNLCVKKEEANNCCKGSCHLNKKLEEEDKIEQKSPLQSLVKEVEIQLISQEIKFEFSNYEVEQEHFFPYVFSVSPFESTSVFQPPEISA